MSTFFAGLLCSVKFEGFLFLDECQFFLLKFLTDLELFSSDI